MIFFVSREARRGLNNAAAAWTPRDVHGKLANPPSLDDDDDDVQ
jgi:hypothetical protein